MVASTLALRLPAPAKAPLLESRVCQYENSPDGDLIIDRHPNAENVWIIGGGSGHGFKFGPAIGEHMARLVLERERPKERFRLARFRGEPRSPKTQMEKPWRASLRSA